VSRDPNRIPKALQILGQIWAANPDLRLGQIMGNASISYYTEDDKAVLALEQWLDYYEQRNNP